jgi:hypothetical protein
MNDFEGAIPILNVRDVSASIDYYVNKLGFEKKWDGHRLRMSGDPTGPPDDASLSTERFRAQP